jgi:hypothetical protein
MPLMILYGGELVFMFLAARIARWMWRSRECVLALWRERNAAPSSDPELTPDPTPQRAPLPRGEVIALPARRELERAA